MAQRKSPTRAGAPWVIALIAAARVEKLGQGTYRIDGTTVGFSVEPAGELPPEGMPPVRVPLYVFLEVVPGPARGLHQIRLTFLAPDGARQQLAVHDLSFTDDTQVVASVVPLDLRVSEAGVYWLEAWDGGDLLTRSPLTVRYHRPSRRSDANGHRRLRAVGRVN